MKRTFIAKTFINKNNKQISFTIPRRRIKFLNDKIPKSIKFKIEELR